MAEEDVKSASEIVPVELRRVRKRKGWDQQQLADRLAELGVPIDRATISKIETRDRKITLDEVFSFALALGVSPAALVLPRAAGSMVAVTPKSRLPAGTVESWLQRVSNLGPARDAITEIWKGRRPVPSSDSELADALDLEAEFEAERFYSEEILDEVAIAFKRWPELASIRWNAVRAVSTAVADITKPGVDVDRSALRMALKDVRDTADLLLTKLDREDERESKEDTA